MKKSNIPQESKYDVAVIGAGPAGASAAISSARSGAKTILIERSPRLWYTSTSAVLVETPRPFEGYLLEKIATIELRAPHITHQIDAGGAVIDYPRWLIDRVNAAGQLGVDVLVGAAANLKVERGRVTGVVVQSGPWAREFSTACVVDTTGVQYSAEGRISGAVLHGGAGVENVLYEFGNVSGASTILLFSEFHAPGGLAWCHPSAKWRAITGLRHIKGTEIALQNLVKGHERLSKIFEKATLNAYAVTFSPGALLARTFTDGLIVAGSAAGHAYPLRITNLELAIQSGEIAGRAAARYGGTRRYEDIWRAKFGRGLAAAYDLHSRLSQELYDAKMDELVRMAKGGDKSASMLLKCLTFSGDMVAAARISKRFPDLFKPLGR